MSRTKLREYSRRTRPNAATLPLLVWIGLFIERLWTIVVVFYAARANSSDGEDFGAFSSVPYAARRYHRAVACRKMPQHAIIYRNMP